MTKNNRKKAVAQAIFTAVALGWAIMQVESAQAATFVVTASDAITITGSDVLLRRVPELSAIAGGNINLGAGGNITLNSGTLILRAGTLISKPVPEPSAIAGSILAGSLAWLTKRNLAAFRKAKV